MSTVLASFVILLLVVAGMAIGVIFVREPITGSCGGLNKAGVDETCELCGGNPNKCEETAR